MNRLLQNRLVLQLLFAFLAAVSVASLSVVLISQAIQGAERVILGETNKLITNAISELKQQYAYRVASDLSWQGLPVQARDVSARGISQAVLRSYPGVEGGFYVDKAFLGYAFPTHDAGAEKTDVPLAESGLIRALAQKSLDEHRPAAEVFRGKADLLVLGAVPLHDNRVAAWAMKRLAGRGTPGAGQRDMMLSILVLAALISVAGTFATGLSLARGVAEIQRGLTKLEQDFDFRLPERSDELGGISRSINRMATIRRTLESELRREDRMRALGRVIAALAHEIRNPLNSIRLTVQLLERKLRTNSIREEDLKTVRAEVDRLNNLLNEVLDLQRVRQPRPQVQAVTPVLQHCIDLLDRQAEMQNTSVKLESSGEEIAALFDAQQLTQTVVNLLLNAIEACSSGGAVHVRAFQRDGKVQVEVQDEGPGLDREQQERLFEPFYTTKPSGTGLGLAVSRELIRSQGGELRLNPSSSGACFVVELPKGSNVDS